LGIGIVGILDELDEGYFRLLDQTFPEFAKESGFNGEMQATRDENVVGALDAAAGSGGLFLCNRLTLGQTTLRSAYSVSMRAWS
jgi:hypothetical protein